ncbi:MAG: N-acetylglucosaminyltransferase [Beijerinckiaceae bacterium]
MRQRVFDGFTFFKELDVLEIRLNELAPVVDRFVIVEATQTFAGKPKPLTFMENRDRFAPFFDKIIHVVVDDFPPARSAWDREFHQRRAIMRGLGDAAPDDFVIISDVDEIPRRTALERVLADGSGANAFTVFGMQEFHHRLNLHRDGFIWWLGSRMVPRHLLRDPQALRKLKAIPSKSAPWMGPLMRAWQSTGVFRHPVRYNLIEDGGWHFTSMGSAADVAEKIRSYSHQEFNTPEFIAEDRIEGLIASGRGLLIPDVKLRMADITKELPAHIGAHRERFAHLLA